jgi:rRNA maturation endonuclease Nob1
MKITKKIVLTVRRCPEGHDAADQVNFRSPMSGSDPRRFCTTCGAALIEVEEEHEYEESICSSCKTVVAEHWEHCPYCGNEL